MGELDIEKAARLHQTVPTYQAFAASHEQKVARATLLNSIANEASPYIGLAEDLEILDVVTPDTAGDQLARLAAGKKPYNREHRIYTSGSLE